MSNGLGPQAICEEDFQAWVHSWGEPQLVHCFANASSHAFGARLGIRLQWLWGTPFGSLEQRGLRGRLGFWCVYPSKSPTHALVENHMFHGGCKGFQGVVASPEHVSEERPQPRAIWVFDSETPPCKKKTQVFALLVVLLEFVPQAKPSSSRARQSSCQRTANCMLGIRPCANVSTWVGARRKSDQGRGA